MSQVTLTQLENLLAKATELETSIMKLHIQQTDAANEAPPEKDAVGVIARLLGDAEYRIVNAKSWIETAIAERKNNPIT